MKLYLTSKKYFYDICYSNLSLYTPFIQEDFNNLIEVDFENIKVKSIPSYIKFLDASYCIWEQAPERPVEKKSHDFKVYNRK